MVDLILFLDIIFSILITSCGAGNSAGLKWEHNPSPKTEVNCRPGGRSRPVGKHDGKPVFAQDLCATKPQSKKKI